MCDMGVDVVRVERGGGALFMQTKPLSKDVMEVVRTSGANTTRGEVCKLLDRKEAAEYEVYMGCKNNTMIRNGNRLLREGRVWFVVPGAEGELITVNVEVIGEEGDDRGIRKVEKVKSKGREVGRVKIVGWREEEGRREAIVNVLEEIEVGGGGVDRVNRAVVVY